MAEPSRSSRDGSTIGAVDPISLDPAPVNLDPLPFASPNRAGRRARERRMPRTVRLSIRRSRKADRAR